MQVPKRGRAGVLAIVLALCAPAGFAQPRDGTSATESGQFPQLPLKRAAQDDGSLSGSIGWAAVFILVLAGAGYVTVRRKAAGGTKGAWNPWLRRVPDASGLDVVGSSVLNAQASVHVCDGMPKNCSWHARRTR